MELPPIEKSLIDFDPKVVFEIGVGPARLSRSQLFWGTAECHLFEPLEEFYLDLRNAIYEFPKVHLHKMAIWKENCEIEFVENGQCSFIKGVSSPTEQHHNYYSEQEGSIENNQQGIEFLTYGPSNFVHKHTQVTARTVDIYDDGNIDVLWLDMEGSEYHALERLVSRPRFISVECKAKMWYTNPHLQEIKDWMGREGYKEVGTHDADIYFKRTT